MKAVGEDRRHASIEGERLRPSLRRRRECPNDWPLVRLGALADNLGGEIVDLRLGAQRGEREEEPV